MITPPDGSGWLGMVARAVFWAGMAMALHWPCCCQSERRSGSTSSLPPTSTSGTSTSTIMPPVPPIPTPPGSSTGTFPLPPIKSSSVGPIQYVACPCCKDGTALADQWQAEVAGVVGGAGTASIGPCTGCEGINGVYICDTADLVLDTQDATGCANGLRGCQCGDADDNSERNPPIDCENLVGPDDLHYPFRHWRLTAAGAYYSFTEVWPTVTRFDIAYSEATLGLCANTYYWEKVWDDSQTITFPSAATCASVPDEKLVPCDSLNGTVLGMPNDDPNFFDDTLCDVGASTCTINAVEGF